MVLSPLCLAIPKCHPYNRCCAADSLDFVGPGGAGTGGSLTVSDFARDSEFSAMKTGVCVCALMRAQDAALLCRWSC